MVAAARLIINPADQVVPTEDKLCRAIARGSLSSVFTIVTIWERSPETLDENDLISPDLTTLVLLSAIEKRRSDMVSLLSAVNLNAQLPVMEAIRSDATGILDAVF